MRRVGIWILTALAMIAVGVLLIYKSLSDGNFDFSEVTDMKLQTTNFYIEDEFTDIRLEAETEDIEFRKADDGRCCVTFLEPENRDLYAMVKNGTLEIRTRQEGSSWTGIFSFLTKGTPRITVYLTEDEYRDLSVSVETGKVVIPSGFRFQNVSVRTSTGDIKYSASCAGTLSVTATTADVSVDEVTLGGLSVSVTTGKVSVNDVTCKGDASVSVSTGRVTVTGLGCSAFRSTGSTGRITLSDVKGLTLIDISRTTGDVVLNGCDADELIIKTDTGDVTGSLLSGKVFSASSDTGKVSVPESSGTGKCGITTDTGDIKITIE